MTPQGERSDKPEELRAPDVVRHLLLSGELLRQRLAGRRFAPVMDVAHAATVFAAHREGVAESTMLNANTADEDPGVVSSMRRTHGDVPQMSANGEGEDLTDALELLAASRLVANDELDEAEALLCRTANPPTSNAALDLLARISVRKGEFGKARRLWMAVLERKGAHEDAKVALARLGSPWLAFAVIKRLGFLATVAIVIALAAVGVIVLSGAPFLANSEPSVIALAPQQARRIGEFSSESASPSPPAITNAQPEPLAAISNDKEEQARRQMPPLFSIPGATVTTNATETKIVFNEGLFAYRCDFNESARVRLELAGQSVKEHTPGCWIIVEGHTDSDPMPSGSIFRDNFTLGLQRALTAIEVLKVAAAIPAQDVLAASAGDMPPLFPGEDYDTKLRNRTVVIRLVPKPDGMPAEGEKTDESAH